MRPLRPTPAVVSLLAWAPLLTSCLGYRPCPEDWLAAGFRTPEQTFRTFQTALAGELPSLEYRCLSSSLKAREDLFGELAYREFRDQLERELPSFRRLADAEVLEVVELGPERRRIVAEVSVLFVSRRFAVDFVREDFFETWEGGDPVDDDVLPFERAVRRDEDGRILASVHSGWPEAEITELRVGREWKIEDFAELAEP